MKDFPVIYNRTRQLKNNARIETKKDGEHIMVETSAKMCDPYRSQPSDHDNTHKFPSHQRPFNEHMVDHDAVTAFKTESSELSWLRSKRSSRRCSRRLQPRRSKRCVIFFLLFYGVFFFTLISGVTIFFFCLFHTHTSTFFFNTFSFVISFLHTNRFVRSLISTRPRKIKRKLALGDLFLSLALSSWHGWVFKIVGFLQRIDEWWKILLDFCEWWSIKRRYQRY